MKGIALATVMLGGVCAVAVAYPIDPVSLRQLVARADLVAVVRVEQVDEPAMLVTPATAPAMMPSWVAHLRVETTLKGDVPPHARINVPFEGNLICPSPPHYRSGLRMLVFLERPAGAWRTCALSYGAVRLVDDPQTQALVGAVRELQHIAGIADAAQRRNATVAWWLRGLDDKHLRDNVVVDLGDTADALGIERLAADILRQLDPNSTTELPADPEQRALLAACTEADLARFSKIAAAWPADSTDRRIVQAFIDAARRIKSGATGP